MEKIVSLGKIILSKLEEFGYEAYFVGGFVRDLLLNKKSDDIDITTNALPETVEKLFDKTIATGKKYGTVTVFIEDEKFEVTTYRVEKDYLNHRKPESVLYTNHLEEDLKRRDFTINALAMDRFDKIIDLFQGQADLNNKLIRAIGNPDERFNEDALRMLRAIRFVSKLGFSVEEKTAESIRNNIEKISHLSNERVLVEFKKIFKNSYNKEALKVMENLNVAEIFREFNQGIRVYNNSNYELNFIEFFTMSLFLENAVIPDYWRLSNYDRLMISTILEILYKVRDNGFTPYIVYSYGLSKSLSANRIRLVIYNSPSEEFSIKTIFNNLVIKKRSDLKINGSIIKKNIKNIEPKKIGNLIMEIEYHVVNNLLKNDELDLIKYARNKLENING
ncbi:MAG: CCA tRNA nucleotidyltransferase [Candidatus Izemoplasmatales bacterium]|nr:CCA tRNA nucleotidyltransferase [Candidatus Izemoplasmatales bacterium]